MSKSFYNNARAYLKNHSRNLHFSNTLQCQMQKVGGQCNDNKKKYSSKRGEKYQYAEQSCINDKRKKTVPSGY